MVDKDTSIKMQEDEKGDKISKKSKDVIEDFEAKKDFRLFHNQYDFTFEEGKKASETNSTPIPKIFEQNLKTEGVLKK